MTTIAIVGAGTGLGAAVARRFGAEGFAVALVSRTLAHVEELAAGLRSGGTTASGFEADVRDTASLTAALRAAHDELGPVEVLQYSPIPAKNYLRSVGETTSTDLAEAVAFSVVGLASSVEAVLPGMRALGRGAILLVNGGSAVRPRLAVTGTSVAFAAESTYGALLHEGLAADGVHVGQLIVPGAIVPGHPTHDPDVLAERLWSMHTGRERFREFAEAMDS
ncbi:SDR family NAD(P)-dependent oxidoreductase [Kineococcus sp. GCM10028916]|uniref:SDR family NAD(P)-dependent oxidoreductase n=1 Tax=Kineococcus sp. GCM10028916 TaxID=3273394 RepID=UPI00363E07F1